MEVTILYDYRCGKCDWVQEEWCSMHTFKEYTPVCDKCGGFCTYEFNPKGVSFVLKDGPTGSWPSKGERFKKFRTKASETAARRQADRYPYVSRGAIPNYKGAEADSWEEARSAAAHEDGLEVAATFDSKVAEEKARKIA